MKKRKARPPEPKQEPVAAVAPAPQPKAPAPKRAAAAPAPAEEQNWFREEGGAQMGTLFDDDIFGPPSVADEAARVREEAARARLKERKRREAERKKALREMKSAPPLPSAEEICKCETMADLQMSGKSKSAFCSLLRTARLPIVLSGPSGVGKSSLIRLACEDLGMEVLEPLGWEDFDATMKTVRDWTRDGARTSESCLVIETLEMFEGSRRATIKRAAPLWATRVKVVLVTDDAYTMNFCKNPSDSKKWHVVKLFDLFEPDLRRVAGRICQTLGVQDRTAPAMLANLCQTPRAIVNAAAALGHCKKESALRSICNDLRSRNPFEAVEDAMRRRDDPREEALGEHGRGVHSWCWASGPEIADRSRKGISEFSVLADLHSMSDLMDPVAPRGRAGRVVPGFQEVQHSLQVHATRAVLRPSVSRLRGAVKPPSMMWTSRGATRSGYAKVMERRLSEVPFLVDIALAKKDPGVLASFFGALGVWNKRQHTDVTKVFLEEARKILRKRGEKPSVGKKLERWCAKCCPSHE